MRADYDSQSLLFLYALISGAASGIVYELFRAIRVSGLGGKVFTFISDMLFCIFLSFLYVLLIYNFSYGEIRLYAFFGMLGGFCAYYFTLGKLMNMIYRKIRQAINKHRLKKSAEAITDENIPH